MHNLEAYIEWMSSPRRVVITAHHHPDADALGSSLALAHFLQKQNHEVQIILPSEFPGFLDWMPGSQDAIVYTPDHEAYCRQKMQEAEIIFSLDFSTYHRLRALESLYREVEKQARICLIDHHRDPEMESDFMLWSTQASSTAELIYDLIEMCGGTDDIDIPIGECIYAGIVTDTSSFKHPSTTKRVHLIAADLIDRGVDTSRIQGLIYDNNSENRMRFLGFALKDKLRVLKELRTAYFVISAEELQRFDNQLGDTEGLVNYALSIQGVVLAATIIERHDCIRLSFRSTGDFSVNDFARKHFSGGGHKNAAGGNCDLTLQEVEKKFVDLLAQYQPQLIETKV